MDVNIVLFMFLFKLINDFVFVSTKVELFDKHCGPIQSEYGMKHMPTFTKICDNKVDMDAVEEAFKVTCSHRIFEPNR